MTIISKGCEIRRTESWYTINRNVRFSHNNATQLPTNNWVLFKNEIIFENIIKTLYTKEKKIIKF